MKSPKMTTRNTMKAAICKKAGGRIEIEDVPIPEPTGREIRVRVKATSLCHSDVQLVSGIMGPDTFPVTIGHEAVSIVDKLSPEAARYGFQEGDMIGAPLWHDVCLTCSSCRTVGSQFCSNMKLKGFTSPGYFAEYALVDPENAVVVARAGNFDTVDPRTVAPLFCSGITVWDALDRACLRPSETVAIVGVGGLGSMAVRYAHAMGANVIALDVQDSQLEACKGEGGTDLAINTAGLSSEELRRRIAAGNNGNLVDVAIVTSPTIAAYQSTWNILRPEARLIAVGVPDEPIPLPGFLFVTNAIQMIGAKVPTRNSVQNCLDFSLRKNILPRINPRIFRLEEINEMFALMEAGKVHDGRMVVEFP